VEVRGGGGRKKEKKAYEGGEGMKKGEE